MTLRELIDEVGVDLLDYDLDIKETDTSSYQVNEVKVMHSIGTIILGRSLNKVV